METELELGDDAEVASAASHSPEEVGVLGSARLHQFALSGDEVHADQLVDQSVRACAGATRCRRPEESCHPGVRRSRPLSRVRMPGSRRSKSPQSGSRLSPGVPASGSTRIPRIRLRSITRPPSQIDWPGAVPSAPDGDLQVPALCKTQSRDHVRSGAACISAGRRSIDPFQILRCSS